ncbi:inositol 1,4,5-trisphosphate receptor-interacting protein [Labrus mixtus]|uniref:inositol 1,4,5-trisphosphate receptor-interacting protein n=1 Tax=Labrus mixtus TaxID=508554 RepID=UPI0029C0F1C5|nr:inositol 1,4,5-trisphosphate receptor-interacting protein [Labrus mixtus]
MQDTLLRVFVVAVGLLTCPRDDPGVQERDDITSVGMQKHEERQQMGGEKVHHEMASVNEEMTHTDSEGPLDDGQNIAEEEYQAEKPHMSEDVTALKTSQLEHKQEGNSEMGMESKTGEDVQADDSFRDLNRPQGTRVKPEEVVLSSKEQSHLHTKTSENEASDAAWERDFLWYLWNTCSIISIIRFFRKYLGRNSQMNQEETFLFPGIAAQVPLLDTDTLQRFHSKYVRVPSSKMWKEEFLEGFANDLLEAMRTVSDKNGGMVIEDFQMVDVCSIIVPFTPPDPCSFQFLFGNNQASDLQLDMQVRGQIKLLEKRAAKDGCPCQSPDVEDDDMVCLLHCEAEKVKVKVCDVFDDPLCVKDSPFLSQSKVIRWFQSTVKQAWAQISHKYEFELNIRYIDAPGALVVRFRSGKKISFSMNPVVKFNNDAHFFITPCSPTNLDTFWTLSLTNYEDSFFKNISKSLPENSCHSQVLEIVSFLHRRQTALSGSSALKEFHFRATLMHLLLTTEASQWKPEQVAYRLQDLLVFMERSLQKKLLHHALIGNPLAGTVIQLPAYFTQAESVNLFHPLVVHNCMYRCALVHFQEMLKNAHVLIHDYIEQRVDNAECSV